ncbi:hypothetical protein [Fundidesulfovibrio soli]|uniref:hypothetical protein n=1 Tax=Fundidesulfovibrio soli TaxID=2922716 RepID=UPI001FAE987D|nr:hypothetical protein [Fundidesulfovibrio soli]
MPKNKSFLEDFYTETMTEMADNFFSRRRKVEARLEGFAALAGDVRGMGLRALKHWGALFGLLVDEELTIGFFRECGVDAGALPALAAAAGDPWRFTPPFALTFAGRYAKSVRYVYMAVRAATQDYLHGAYGPDPHNPARKILLPNLDSLKALAETINAEVEGVNSGQSPSAVLSFAKSMDPAEVEKEAVVGGTGWEDVRKLDRELAFKAIDLDALGLPELPDIPPLDDVEVQLDALSSAISRLRPEEARRALSWLKAR